MFVCKALLKQLGIIQHDEDFKKKKIAVFVVNIEVG